MAKRYAIWDKQTPVITPSGAVYTAEQWIAKRPAAGLATTTVLVANGEINGAIYDTLGALKNRCESQGATFDDGLTGQDLLDACEAWMDEQEAKAREQAQQPTAEDRQAAALEAIADGQTTENAKALNILLGEE